MGFRQENTIYVINYIKHNDELSDKCRGINANRITEICFEYAGKHKDEFGNRFVLELHDVFWNEVATALE